MAPLVETVRAALAVPGVDFDRTRFAVAFSGGVDSTVLLHVLYRLVDPGRLRVLHVDHGLHAESERWARHCAEVAGGLGLTFVVRTLGLTIAPGRSVEAEARRARYAALADILQADEVLLTAHHADDQLETLFLRLLRGAGVRGLTAIAARMPFGPGYLARPLLEVAGSEIRQRAEAWGLDWIEDPSNLDTRLDRNYLRSAVLPALRSRWPRAPALANRTARRMTEAQSLLDALAALDLPGQAAADAPVPVATLVALGAARERNALRALIARGGLPAPSSLQLEQLRAGLRVTRPGALTCVRWPGAEARCYRGQLYLMPPQAVSAASASGRVSCDEPWSGPEGRLELVPGAGPVCIPESWARTGLELRFRVGGERLRARATGHSVTLKHWFQAAGIVPWARARIPLLYFDGQLVAVADLWGREIPGGKAGEPVWQLRWTEHEPLY